MKHVKKGFLAKNIKRHKLLTARLIHPLKTAVQVVESLCLFISLARECFSIFLNINFNLHFFVKT